jgi:hypothetical protein
MKKIKTFLLRCWYFPTFDDFRNEKYKIDDIWQLMINLRLILSTFLGSIMSLILYKITDNLEIGIIFGVVFVVLAFLEWRVKMKRQFDVLKQEELKKQENTVIDDLGEVKKIAIMLLPSVDSKAQDQLLHICQLINKIEKQLY